MIINKNNKFFIQNSNIEIVAVLNKKEKIDYFYLNLEFFKDFKFKTEAKIVSFLKKEQTIIEMLQLINELDLELNNFKSKFVKDNEFKFKRLHLINKLDAKKQFKINKWISKLD